MSAGRGAAGASGAGEVVRIASARGVPGFMPGEPLRTVLLDVAYRSAPAEVLARFRVAVQAQLGAGTELPLAGHALEPTLAHVSEAALALLAQGGVPRLAPARLLARQAPGRARLALPWLLDSGATLQAFEWACALLRAVATDSPPEKAAAVAQAVSARLAQTAPQGINTREFLRAAHEQGMPWRPVWANVVQFGWGRRQRLLDSSLTDATPGMGARLARQKHAAAAVLRAGGVPVPPHELVRDAEQALQAAQRLGYPVVVKPADLDGGAGVHAGLQRPEQVTAAFAAAREVSSQILVEKHIEGNDHRLQVFRGKVFWATHRVPGGVTGDGERSVGALLAELNADPRRGPRGGNALLKRIELDAEALELLQEQGLDPEAVPAAGRFVRLRRAANVATGGVPVPVLEQAHPDNLALAERAAALLRLDLAGIDLLVPDIARSWLETGGAICEVNAQPQLSPHLPALLLPQLVPDGGRIPVAVLVGASESLVRDVRRALSARSGIGSASPAGVWLDDHMMAPGPLDSCSAGIALLADPRVEVALLDTGGRDVLRHGLPVDRYDVLVLGDALPPGEAAEAPAWQQLARWLAPGCTQCVLAATDQPLWNALGSRLAGRPVHRRPGAELAQALASLLSDGKSC